jgi:O-antigen/teichoic acid export membrane protein
LQDREKGTGALSQFARVLLSRTSRSAMIYLSAMLVNLAIPFVLIPILTRYLPPSGYGHIAMFQTVSAIATAAAAFGVNSSLLKAFTVGTKTMQAEYLLTCITIMAVASAVLLSLAIAFSSRLQVKLDLPEMWLLLAVVTGIAGAVFQMKLTTLRAQGHAAAYGALLNVQTVINFTASILLVVILRTTWHGRTAAMAFSALVLGGWSLYTFAKSGFAHKIQKEHLHEALTLGAAASVHTILNALIGNVDRVFLSAAYTPHVLGVYTVASQLAQGYGILGSALNLAWAPWCFRQLAAMQTQAQAARLIRTLLIASGLILFGTVLYGLVFFGLFHIIVGGKYAGAEVYFPPLLAGVCFQNIYLVFVFPLFYYKKPKVLAANAIIVSSITLFAIFKLARMFGPLGVAYTVTGLRLLLCVAAIAAGLFLIRQGWKSTLADPSPIEPEIAA